MSHTCHAMGCETSCSPSKLMCVPHWVLVPFADKRAVLRTYHPGQERQMNPSPAYLRAAMEAVIAVAIKEGYTDDEIETAPAVQGYAAWIEMLEKP